MTPHSSSARGQVPPYVNVGCELFLADAVMRQPLRGDGARDRLDVVAPACHGRKLTPPPRTLQAVGRFHLRHTGAQLRIETQPQRLPRESQSGGKV